MANKVCATCAFFMLTDDEQGECRHHTPSANGFPPVQRLGWCGEWIANNLEYDSRYSFGHPWERQWRQEVPDCRIYAEPLVSIQDGKPVVEGERVHMN